MTSALILDCDGVLADTERYGHLVAFNQTFEEFGLPVRWSVAEYQEKLLIGGGKERMASLLTPEFIAAAGLPADPAGQQAAVAAWHRRKTEIYLGLVADGAVPPRPGIARIVAAAARPRAGPWRSPPRRARGLGPGRRSNAPSARTRRGRSACSPGDIVPRKKPAPDIYLLALRALGRARVRCRRRRGLAQRPARRDRGRDLTCLITVNDFTADEDFGEAALVVSSPRRPRGRAPGRPRQPQRRDARRLGHAGRPRHLTAHRKEVSPCPKRTSPTSRRSCTRSPTSRWTNEKYFGDLDAVVGDGDFGYSMARGFELVLQGWDDFDRADIGTFLKKIAVVITSRIGGTSGPIWGTAFLRAGASRRERARCCRHGSGRRDAAGGDRRHQGARQVRRRRQDAARRAGARGRHASRPGP